MIFLSIIAKKWKKYPRRIEFENFLKENSLYEKYTECLFRRRVIFPVTIDRFLVPYLIKDKEVLENKVIEICEKLEKYLEVEFIYN